MFGKKKAEQMNHHKCEVCRIIGHEPEMIKVRTYYVTLLADWVHNSCIAGSEFERRKDKRNEAHNNDYPETPEA